MLKMEFPVSDSIKFSERLEKPEVLFSFVDKHVKIQLIKNTLFVGFLHSIDPISYSVILSIPEKEIFKTILIPGHAILDIAETDITSNTSPPIRRTLEHSEGYGSEKNKVIAWLKWNLLPVSEDGEKIIFGNASLLPPYGVTDICTDNPMVAMQMKKIIEAMPHDFEAPKS